MNPSALQSGAACDFIRECRIDSYRKLMLVLCLYQNPEWAGSIDALAQRLHWGSSFFIEDVVAELEGKGVVEREQTHFRLARRPKVQQCANCLLNRFEDPLARQNVLAQIRKYNVLKPGGSHSSRLN